MSIAIRAFEPSDVADVREIMEASLATDGIPGFVRSDIDRALTRIVPDPTGTVVAVEDGQVVGYCTPNHDDLTVHPAARRRGHGRRLIPAADALVRSRGLDELQLYVPSHLPASVAFAEALGFRYRSSLWQFQLPPGRTVARPSFPSAVRTRHFDPALDTDTEAWVAFMLAAFEGHPTPMTWTPSVIAHVNASPDFDPTGILLVTPADAPTEPVAFAKIERSTDDQGTSTGDVGLIGVLPAWRGQGIGRELLRWGVTELRRRGAELIELSVEAANDRATRLYRAHGFEPAIEWPHWVLEEARS